MAGLGGAIVVPTQAAVLGMGVDALVIAFVVVVIGGLGSLKGALVGAGLLSFVRTPGIPFFPGLGVAGVLFFSPPGLFWGAHRAVWVPGWGAGIKTARGPPRPF